MHCWGGICGRGACMAGGVHAQRGVHGRGACVVGGMHGRGVYMVGGVCMVRGEACVTKIRLVNARAVRILLECILVFVKFPHLEVTFMVSGVFQRGQL